jgi:hypothetical protein
MKNKLQLLLHPVFILSLACLLLNDIYWKYEYHNWLTGKISDLTGLFVLSVFLSAFFHRHTISVYIGIAIFFIWWKSPLSQPIIDILNRSLDLSFKRTIDYTDLFVIPFILAAGLLKPPAYNFSLANRLAIYFVSAVCLVAFCSTSYYRKFMISPDMGPRINYNETYSSRFNQEHILYKLDSMQLAYQVDSFTTVPLSFYGGSILIKDRDSGRTNMMIITPEQKDTAAYFRINERPYIAIYNLKIKDVVIPQVNIRVTTYVRTSDINLESIILDDEQIHEYYQKMSKNKKKFRKLVEEGLIRKLK